MGVTEPRLFRVLSGWAAHGHTAACACSPEANLGLIRPPFTAGKKPNFKKHWPTLQSKYEQFYLVLEAHREVLYFLSVVFSKSLNCYFCGILTVLLDWLRIDF